MAVKTEMRRMHKCPCYAKLWPLIPFAVQDVVSTAWPLYNEQAQC